MKLAVIGSRGFNNYDMLKSKIDKLRKSHDIDTIVSGGANGADKLAKKYAIENNIKIEEYLPEWDKYGKSAGFIRNTTIWDNSDIGIAFWDGRSKGTKHSFDIAKKQNKECIIIDYSKFDIFNW